MSQRIGREIMLCVCVCVCGISGNYGYLKLELKRESVCNVNLMTECRLSVTIN